MRTLVSLFALIAVLALAGCGNTTSPSSQPRDEESSQKLDEEYDAAALADQFAELNQTTALYVAATLKDEDASGYYDELRDAVPAAIKEFRKDPDAIVDEDEGTTARQTLSDVASDLEDTDESGQEFAQDIDRALDNP